MEIVYASHTGLRDLDIYECGDQACSPGYRVGPSVREFYLLHFIHAGKGTFSVGKNNFSLQEGQGFLICPGMVSQYTADLQTPWHYTWIAFNGEKASHYLDLMNMDYHNSIFHFDDRHGMYAIFQRMLATKTLKNSRKTQLLGLFYQIISPLIENTSTATTCLNRDTMQQLYVTQAVEFIQVNFYKKIFIKDIARSIGIDYRYLCVIFKAVMNISPHNFLTEIRIQKACKLLEDCRLSIGDVSRSVSYDDPAQFTKIFSKLKGKSPSAYRKRFISQ